MFPPFIFPLISLHVMIWAQEGIHHVFSNGMQASYNKWKQTPWTKMTTLQVTFIEKYSKWNFKGSLFLLSTILLKIEGQEEGFDFLVEELSTKNWWTNYQVHHIKGTSIVYKKPFLFIYLFLNYIYIYIYINYYSYFFSE